MCSKLYKTAINKMKNVSVAKQQPIIILIAKRSGSKDCCPNITCNHTDKGVAHPVALRDAFTVP